MSATKYLRERHEEKYAEDCSEKRDDKDLEKVRAPLQTEDVDRGITNTAPPTIIPAVAPNETMFTFSRSVDLRFATAENPMARIAIGSPPRSPVRA